MTEKQAQDLQKVKRWCDEHLLTLYKQGLGLWDIASQCLASLFPDEDRCAVSPCSVRKYMEACVNLI